MLEQVGLLTAEERSVIHAALDRVGAELADGSFAFAPTDEDIHTAIERRVTEIAGGTGAKLHTGRSRNDQVALDLRLYVRREGYDQIARIHAAPAGAAAARQRDDRGRAAGLHAPATRAAGAARAPSARALLGVRP